jgi:hypothetical protein
VHVEPGLLRRHAPRAVHAPVGETSDSDAVEAIAVDGQGRLLALSNPVYELAMGRHASPVIHVQRFLADGSLDASFGDGGRAEHVIGVKLYTDGALAVDAQHRVLYGARLFGDGFDDFTYPSRIVRLAADGRIDPTWQGDRMPGFAPGVPVTAIVPQADGTTLALVGHELVRLRADGTLDPAFGDGDGRVELPAEFDARAAVAAPGGGLFVAGRVGGDLALLQLGRDGAPLRGRRALHTTDLPEGRTGTAEDLAVAPDGRVVLIGRAVDDGAVVLARYSLKRQRLRWP